MEENLKKTSIAIVSHIYSTGPAHALEEYLSPRVDRMLFIGHPFVFAKDKRSYKKVYKNGKVTQHLFFPFFVSNQFINLVKDFVTTIIWVFQFGKIDIFVGIDNTNACLGIILKKLGFVKKVIFYTIDYIPNRYENTLINGIYHWLDTYAVTQSSLVWNLSSVMTDMREKKGVSKRYRKKQIVVPMGTEEIRNISFTQSNKYHVAHMGHLLEKQGVQLAIEAIPLIVKKYPKFHLDIIGGGSYEQTLKQLASSLEVSQYITFYGFIESHKKVAELLGKCAFALAPYVDTKDNYVRYTDPGKVKAYLAAGLPIIITNITEVARILDKEKAGFSIDYTKRDLANAVLRLFSQEKLLKEYRENARNLAKKYTWNSIFSSALQSLV